MPKPNDPLNPDNAPNPPTTPARRKEGDNTLPPDADVEERVNDLIRKYGGPVLAGIGVAALIILVVMTVRWWQERSEMKVRESFATAQETAELQSFAQEHDDHPLGGLALLEIANRQYEQGQYAEAAGNYSRAAEVLGENPASARARLGAAMAQLFGGNEAAGEQALRQLLEMQTATDLLRAQAGFNLALHYWQQDNFEAMRQVIDSVETISNGGIYQMQALQLRNRLPPVETPVEAAAAPAS